MRFKILGFGIVVFWGVMTALLVRAVYFPAFERLPEVEPGRVLELFIDHKDVTHLYFYREDGEVVGDVMLTPRRQGEAAEIGFAAVGVVELPSLPRQKLNWRGKLLLGPAPGRKLAGVEISVRFSEPKMTVAMEIDPVSFAFQYKVIRDGVVMSDSRDDAGGMGVGVAQMQMLMAAWGLNPAAAGGGEPARLEARQGFVEIGGHRAGAYFVVLDLPGLGRAKLTFSEAGELLRIDTPLGYELLCEALRTPPEPLPY